jgi:two-component system, OmpR family, response regulator
LSNLQPQAAFGLTPEWTVMKVATKILVVDDDPRLRELLRYTLSREGYQVSQAADGAAALREIQANPPDLVVLDVLMPELDGMGVCRAVRGTSSVPIIFLSSRADAIDRVLGLELGADDYLSKPFSTLELVSRVKAVLRRARPQVPEVLQVAGVRLDPVAHRAWVDQIEVALTVTEFRILQTLMRSPGRAYTREELVEHAYDGRHFVSGRTVDSHVRRIRKKLKTAGAQVIETVHGHGYRLVC